MISTALEAGCDGFILGPLYSDDNGRFVRFIPDDVLKETPYQKVTVAWSAHAPIWRRYEDKNRLQSIANVIKEKGGRVFMSSVDALKFTGQKGAMV